MSTRLIVGIVALACVSICGLVMTLTGFEMVERVNEKLPEEKQFETLGWYPSKTYRLHREYRKIYPEGRLLLRVRVLIALMFTGSLVCVWDLGFFAK